MCPELTHPAQQLSGQRRPMFYTDFLCLAKNDLDLISCFSEQLQTFAQPLSWND